MDIVIPLHFMPYYIYGLYYLLLFAIPSWEDVRLYAKANLPGLVIFFVIMLVCKEIFHLSDVLSLCISFPPDYVVRFHLNKKFYNNHEKDTLGQVILYFTMGAFGVGSPYVLNLAFKINVWESQIWLALPTVWLHYRATQFIFNRRR